MFTRIPYRAALVRLAAVVVLAGCAAPSNHPPGVPANIAFRVQPVYPRSFDVTATASRATTQAALEEAWRKKAAQLAAGRRYQSSPLHGRGTETITSLYTGYANIPMVNQSRSVSGTVTLLE